MTIRVIVADDQGMVRAGFTTYLSAHDDLAVIGEAADGQAAVALTMERQPDVVVMDVRMPGLDGIEATRAIVAAYGETAPQGEVAANGVTPANGLSAAQGETRTNGERGGPAVLVVTTFDLDQYVYQALRAGAAGFLLKDASAAELAEAVRTVAAGDAIISPSITRRLIADFARLGGPRAPTQRRLGALTNRETEVLALVAQALSNREIAEHLVLTQETIKTHVGRILTKLGLRDRAQAIVFAYESGLIRVDSED